MGYVGNHARCNPHQPEERTGGEQRLRKLRRYHQRHSLDLPLGPASEGLNLEFPPEPPPDEVTTAT